MVNCYFCGEEMTFENEYRFSEIYGEGEGKVLFYHCSSCKSDAEFSKRTDIEIEEEREEWYY